MSRDRDPIEGGRPDGPPRSTTGDGEVCPTVVHFEQWKDGDEAAFDALYWRFAPLLRERIRRNRAWPLLVDQLPVDDVLQEIWARAVPAAKQNFLPSGPGSLFAFLGKIADRAVIDLARRHRAQKRGEGGVQSLGTGVEVADSRRPGRCAPETPTSHARASELMTMAGEVLSEREFKAWDLVEIQGYSTEEAGLAMRSSSSAVRGLLMRGRVKLVARVSHGLSE